MSVADRFTRTFPSALPLGAALALAACGGNSATASYAPVDRAVPGAPASARALVPSPSDAPSIASAAPAGSSQPSPAVPAALPVAPDLKSHAVFREPALFVVTGEDGRIGVLAEDAGEVVPYRREGGAWQRLTLPPSHRAQVGALQAGIYFGRDNRPRLMGYHTDPGRIVYLRFKDDAWHPELREIGPLGKEGPAPLFGVLGEADPEVVCRVGDRCLIKSRAGWKETPASLAPTAVVRAFEGKGYAVTEEGVFRADDKRFVRVGPPAPWRGQPTGFWVGPGESIAVVERDAGVLHTLESAATSAWAQAPLPIEGPIDVAGPAGDRFVAGDGGLIHRDGGGAWSRVGDIDGAQARVIVASWGIVSGGRAGVFEVSRDAR